MPSTATSILDGLSTSVAVKAPCRTVATSNITLSGLQTISGYTTVENDRVLVKGQTDPVENGIYMASTGSWARAKDADGARDLVQGTRVIVRSTTIDGVEYELTTANPIVIGTTELTFELRYGANATYDQTEAEIAAGVAPVNYNIPSHTACGYAVVERYGTNTTPGTTDMTAAVQAAVDVAREADCAVGVITTCRLASSINIDIAVNSAEGDSYFRIVGLGKKAGFWASEAVNMFSSTIAFTTAPVVQMVRFENLNFEQVDTSFSAYVLHDARYLRTGFVGCNFIRIKCLTAPTVHTQTIYFIDCNMRRWTGIFFESLDVTYDLKVQGCWMEAGVEAWKIDFPVGSSFHGNLIEGMNGGAAIRAESSHGLTISGNYFESNTVDIVLNVGTQQGVAVIGNMFASSVGTWNIFWGTAVNCVSFGNYSTAGSGLHNLAADSQVAINDYSDVAVSNRAGQSSLLHNVPLFDVYNNADQTVTTATFTKCTLNTETIDTNANFATSTFTATIPGYYVFNCKLNAKAVGGSITRIILSLYKNGTEFQRLVDLQTTVTDGTVAIVSGSCELLLNATDYVEMWGALTGAGTPAFGFNAIPEATRFSGNLVRSS